MCFGSKSRKIESSVHSDVEEDMPDLFVTRPTVMMGNVPRETKIVTKINLKKPNPSQKPKLESFKEEPKRTKSNLSRKGSSTSMASQKKNISRKGSSTSMASQKGASIVSASSLANRKQTSSQTISRKGPSSKTSNML